MSSAAETDPPMIRMVEVHKHFGSLHVLRDINLEVARGEVVVVLGRPGQVSRHCAARSTGWSRSIRAASRSTERPSRGGQGTGSAAGRCRHGLPAVQPLCP